MKKGRHHGGSKEGRGGKPNMGGHRLPSSGGKGIKGEPARTLRRPGYQG